MDNVSNPIDILTNMEVGLSIGLDNSKAKLSNRLVKMSGRIDGLSTWLDNEQGDARANNRSPA